MICPLLISTDTILHGCTVRSPIIFFIWAEFPLYFTGTRPREWKTRERKIGSSCYLGISLLQTPLVKASAREDDTTLTTCTIKTMPGGKTWDIPPQSCFSPFKNFHNQNKTSQVIHVHNISTFTKWLQVPSECLRINLKASICPKFPQTITVNSTHHVCGAKWCTRLQ